MSIKNDANSSEQSKILMYNPTCLYQH